LRAFGKLPISIYQSLFFKEGISQIMETNKNSKMQEYWRANVRVIATLLAIWAAVSYVAAILLATALHDIKLGSVPLGFWFGHQGSIVTFVILIFVYVKLMDGIDEKFDVHEVKR
jgi:putative solute:sodium symporter small subunit